MARVIHHSSTGLAVTGTFAVVAVILACNADSGAPSARAQSSRINATAGSPDQAATVQVTEVNPTIEDLHRVTTQPAHVEAYERTDILAKASGFIAHVMVDLGDRVAKDQILAELWIPEMEQELRQKAALVEQARAAVEQAQARFAAADDLIAAAESKMVEAQAAIEQHESEVDYRRSEHRRISELVANKSLNMSLEDEKLKQLKSAESALAAALAQVQSAQAGIRVEHSRKLQAQADVAHAQSQLKVAEADFQQTEILARYAKIRAPYSGVISRRFADTGDFVASATNARPEPLFMMERVDRLRIVFDIPESESGKVQIGQTTTLVVDALSGRSFPGRIARTAGVLDPRTRTLRVEAELDELDSALRPGMFGMISVILAEREKTVMVPTRCIRFERNEPHVLCINRDVVEKRAVELGFTDGAKTEIISGVSPTDRIVLESRFPIRPGHSVRVALRK